MTDYSYIMEKASHFCIDGEFNSSFVAESGHINTTHFVEYKDNGQYRRYVIQRINTNVFKRPIEVMENIEKITDHIRAKIEAAGMDADRGVLRFVRAKDGTNYYIDDHGGFWRAYIMVENARTYESAGSPRRFFKVGKAFGNFQMQLSDFPASELHETIPDFHNTTKRFRDFEEAIRNDVRGRVKKVTEEIEFIRERANLYCPFIYNGIEDGRFRVRVTHNDTKMDNIMIDDETDEPVCVIDLDTVMPGSVLNDFGDAIRFGASSALEDETDLDRVYLRLDMFESFTRGFIEGMGGSLLPSEISALPMGAVILTFETGMRFLTDYINGDVYFRVHREEHNLDRARCQLKLVDDMETKLNKMNKIVNSILDEK